MHEDDLVLLGAYLLLGTAATALSVRSRHRGKTILSHMIIMVLYSAPLLYGLFALSNEGNALAWWFYLLLAVGAHLLVITLLLVRRPIAKPRAS